MRWLCMIAIGASLLAPLAAAQDDPQMIRIGVRVDTRPFAWYDTEKGIYMGFLVDLCTQAVTRAGHPFVQLPVTAEQRTEFLEGRNQDYDLLCDPTTISLKRLDAFAAMTPPDRLQFSPIVFVANGAWVRNPREKLRPMNKPPAGTTCLPVMEEMTPSAEDIAVAKQEYLTAGFVGGTTAQENLSQLIRANALGLAPHQSVCAVPQPSHEVGIEAFCNGSLAYYLGDLDIVTETVKYLKDIGKVAECDFDHALKPISYEPYALVVSNSSVGFRTSFIAALYEIFTAPNTGESAADHYFRRHFHNQAKSPFLDTLFRINRLPPG